jgi:hypothetical protein
MAAKKRSAKKTNQRENPIARRLRPILATASGSLPNMTVTGITSAAVLLCLFAAKRFSQRGNGRSHDR